MEPLKDATEDANRISMPGFLYANNKPCQISEKARKKGAKKAAELFAFSNTDPLDELISVKRKAYTDPDKSAKKKKLVLPKVQVEVMSDWSEEEETKTGDANANEDDDELEWSDCDADLSRTIVDFDTSIRNKSSEENIPTSSPPPGATTKSTVTTSTN